MGIRHHKCKDVINCKYYFLVPYVHFSMELTICQIQPPDLLFLVMFCISFYISRYHFPEILRSSFGISEKKFCHRFLLFSRFTQPPLLPPPTLPQRRKSTNMMKVSSYSVTVKHYTVYLKNPTANTLIPTPKNTEELKKQ